jgi:ABC-2 type transport system permease protein
VKQHLQLLRLLIHRDLTLRYKRSAIGIGWTLLNPILTSFVLWVAFSFVFASKLSGGQQYAPYLMSGILLNAFWGQGLVNSAEAIQMNSSVLTKVAVPPQIFTLASAISASINFCIGLLPLCFVVIISGSLPAISFPLVFLVGISMAVFISGIALMLSVLYIRFDDTKNIVGVLLLIQMYTTPIFYPISVLDPNVQAIVRLNPINSFLECFRWSLTGLGPNSILNWLYIFSISIFCFVMGVKVFKRFWPRTVAML